MAATVRKPCREAAAPAGSPSKVPLLRADLFQARMGQPRGPQCDPRGPGVRRTARVFARRRGRGHGQRSSEGLGFHSVRFRRSRAGRWRVPGCRARLTVKTASNRDVLTAMCAHMIRRLGGLNACCAELAAYLRAVAEARPGSKMVLDTFLAIANLMVAAEGASGSKHEGGGVVPRRGRRGFTVVSSSDRGPAFHAPSSDPLPGERGIAPRPASG